MPADKRHIRLELETDEKFSRRNAIVERIVWVLLSLFVLAGFIGFFGKGGISKTRKQSPDGTVLVNYERFLRYNTQSEIELSLLKGNTADSIRLSVGGAFIEDVIIESISPEPVQSRLSSRGHTYIFRNEPGNSIPRIILYFRPLYSGQLESTITAPGGQALSIAQFVYP